MRHVVREPGSARHCTAAHQSNALPPRPPRPPSSPPRSYVVRDGYTYPDDYPGHEERFAWRSAWSDEHQRAYFHNSATGEATWERPADLAWKRLRYHAEL